MEWWWYHHHCDAGTTSGGSGSCDINDNAMGIPVLMTDDIPYPNRVAAATRLIGTFPNSPRRLAPNAIPPIIPTIFIDVGISSDGLR